MPRSAPPAPQFFYHASALALGGRVTRPYCEVIEPQAAAVLPPVGGHGHARVENFRHRDVVSIRSASATVSGSPASEEAGTVFNTLATVTIEGLDVAGVVTADRIVARLVSEHDGSSRDLPIHPTGSYFENLRVAGVEIRPRPHGVLFEAGTLQALGARGGEAKGGPVDLCGRTLAAPKAPEAILTSLFERPAALPPGCEAAGAWGIAIAGFGRVYAGELSIARGERRLTMLRIEMGSPVRGVLSLGYVGGNGTTHP